MIKYWWRVFRKRCIVCGKKRENHMYCPHCKYPRYCHECGERFNWSKVFRFQRLMKDEL